MPPGGGLRVQVTLPIDCTPTLRNDPQLLSGARVLVVDASATGRSVTTHLCNSWSMQTQEADCQSVAIAILRAQANIGQPVDVVLIDQDLPEGALSLAERIRSLPAADDVLLLLCGQSAPETALRLWPGAQSAATSLAAIRSQQGRRSDALALMASSIQKRLHEDPWRRYGRGDYRLEELLQQLPRTL